MRQLLLLLTVLTLPAQAREVLSEFSYLSVLGSAPTQRPSIRLGVPVYIQGNDVFIATARTTALSFPKAEPDFYDFSTGMVYSHAYDDGDRWTGRVGVGSLGDRVFRAKDLWKIDANYSYRWKLSDDRAFTLSIDYSNLRGFLENVPLPGAEYSGTLGDWGSFGFGLPFVRFNARSDNGWSVALTQFFIALVHLEAGWAANDRWGFYGIGDYSQLSYPRADRNPSDLRTRLQEARVGGMVRWAFAKNFEVEAEAGYAFSRSLFESTSFIRGSAPATKLDDAPYVRVAFLLVRGDSRR